MVDKSNINKQLEVYTAGGNPDTVAGDFGRHPLYKMMGYFSLVGLLRLHSLLGDFHQAIKVPKLPNMCLNSLSNFTDNIQTEVLRKLLDSLHLSIVNNIFFVNRFWKTSNWTRKACTPACQGVRSPCTTTLVSPTWWWGGTPTQSGPSQTFSSISNEHADTSRYNTVLVLCMKDSKLNTIRKSVVFHHLSFHSQFIKDKLRIRCH